MQIIKFFLYLFFALLLFVSCETEREEPPVALQLFQSIHVEVKDMEGRNLLSNESDAFRDEEIEVRFVKGGKPYFNANMTNNPRGFSVKRTDDSPYLKLSLSEITKKLSETDESSQYETEIFLTLKGNAEKNIKVLYEINKVSDGGFVTDFPKTLKVWVDEKLSWQPDASKPESTEKYQARITLEATVPKR